MDTLDLVLIIIGSIILSIIVLFLLFHVVVICIGICYKSTNVKCKSSKRLDGKTCLVTGGTAGMGLEIATELARRNARVIIACPFEEEGTNAEKEIKQKTSNKQVIFKRLDLSSLADVRKFAEDILKTEDRLDILINNAGVMFPNKLTADGINFILQVNYFGHFLLTLLLLPLLKKTGTPSERSRILNTSSLSHSTFKLDFENMTTTNYSTDGKIYANSKVCMAIFTRELTKKLSPNIVVNTVDPGVAVTTISGTGGAYKKCSTVIIGRFYPNAWDGAQTALHLALDDKCGEVSGEYFKNCKLSKAGRNAHDEKTLQRLWEESVNLVKLSEKELRLSISETV